MTSDDFRLDPALRDELAKVMQNPALQQALAIVKSKGTDVVMPLGMDGLDHARALAEIQTRTFVVNELLLMTKPMSDIEDDRPEETFGSGHPISAFDEPPPETT